MNYLGFDNLNQIGNFMEIYIYSLKDPEFDLIRYIGKTTDPYKRENEHINRNLDLPLYRWIEELKCNGKEPFMDIIELCDESNCLLLERYFIKKYDTPQNKLLNIRSRHHWGSEVYLLFQSATFFRKAVRKNKLKSYIVVIRFENGQHWVLKGNRKYYYYISDESRNFKITRRNPIYKMDVFDLPILKDNIKIFSDFNQVKLFQKKWYK